MPALSKKGNSRHGSLGRSLAKPDKNRDQSRYGN